MSVEAQAFNKEDPSKPQRLARFQVDLKLVYGRFPSALTMIAGFLKIPDHQGYSDPRIEAFFQKITSDPDDATLGAFFDYYRQTVTERLRGIKTTVGRVREEGQQRVHAAIDIGRLPISHEYARERFEKTDIVLIDEFSSDVRDARQYNGLATSHMPTNYAWTVYKGNENKHIICISEKTPQDQIDTVVQEELVHVLSGQTYPGNPESTMRGWAILPDFLIPQDHLRSGLNFKSANKASYFSWLNEAVAHEIRNDLLAQNGDMHDVHEEEGEIGLYRVLREKGKVPVPQELFEAAFFENYDHREGLPRWRALEEAINASFPPKFLFKLDEKIRQRVVLLPADLKDDARRKLADQLLGAKGLPEITALLYPGS